MSETSKPGDPASPGAVRVERNKLGPTVLTVAALAVFVYLIRLILIPFVIAGALAFILSILIDYITRRLGLPRPAVATAVFILFIAFCAAIAYLVYPTVAGEASQFASNLKKALTEAFEGILGKGQINVLGGVYTASQLAIMAENALKEWISNPSNLVFIAGAGFSLIFSGILSAVILFYFLLSGRKIVAGLVFLAPPHYRPIINKIIIEVNPVLRRYFLGVGVVVTYAAIAAYIGLGMILGIKHAFFLAIATGFLEMIPVVGPAASGVLAGLVALQGASGIWDVFKYIIYATALRLSIDQLIGPLILGRAASLSPVTVIFCFLAGGILYGFIGVILAVPVALSIRIALKTLYGEMKEAEG